MVVVTRSRARRKSSASPKKAMAAASKSDEKALTPKNLSGKGKDKGGARKVKGPGRPKRPTLRPKIRSLPKSQSHSRSRSVSRSRSRSRSISRSPVRGSSKNVARKTTRLSAAFQSGDDYKEWLKNYGANEAKQQHGSSPHQELLSGKSFLKKPSLGVQYSDIDFASDEDETEETSSLFSGEEDEEELLTDFSEESGLGQEDEEYEEEGSEIGGVAVKKKRGAGGGPNSSLPSSPQRKRTKAGPGRRVRGISGEDRRLIHRMIHENKDPAVIVNAAQFRPGRRRRRMGWTPAEVMDLRMGVDRFGLAWAEILKCPDYRFHPHRTQVDLKDKWRNLTAYRPYGSHGLREFILLDENHQPLIRPDTGRPYHFKNRWPRDAALKAASRDEFYLDDAEVTTIFVREVGTTPNSVVPPIVHVYQGTRRREMAPPHLNELEIRTVWSSEVCKVREERFISQEDLKNIEREAVTSMLR